MLGLITSWKHGAPGGAGLREAPEAGARADPGAAARAALPAPSCWSSTRESSTSARSPAYRPAAPPREGLEWSCRALLRLNLNALRLDFAFLQSWVRCLHKVKGNVDILSKETLLHVPTTLKGRPSSFIYSFRPLSQR